jgi:hypothetical protein
MNLTFLSKDGDEMNKAIALIITLFVGGALMIYSASRTLALLQLTLPTGQGDMAFLALAAFDGGLVAWVLTFMFGASGAWQRGIAALMIIICLVGVVVGFGADSILGALNGGIVAKGAVDGNFGLTVVLATVAIIALNIAAVTAFHVLSPENRRRMQEETFSDHIEAAAFQKSNEAIPQLAAQLAAQLTESRMARLNAKYQSMIATDERAGFTTRRAEVIAARPVRRVAAATDEPSPLDKIKSRLSEAISPKPGGVATLASDGLPLASHVVPALPTEDVPAHPKVRRRAKS